MEWTGRRRAELKLIFSQLNRAMPFEVRKSGHRQNRDKPRREPPPSKHRWPEIHRVTKAANHGGWLGVLVRRGRTDFPISLGHDV
jgi:hypothetical protein